MCQYQQNVQKDQSSTVELTASKRWLTKVVTSRSIHLWESFSFFKYRRASRIENNSGKVFCSCLFIYSYYPVIFQNLPRIIKQTRKRCYYVYIKNTALFTTPKHFTQIAFVSFTYLLFSNLIFKSVF